MDKADKPAPPAPPLAEELIASMEEAAAILRGEKPPARVHRPPYEAFGFDPAEDA